MAGPWGRVRKLVGSIWDEALDHQQHAAGGRQSSLVQCCSSKLCYLQVGLFHSLFCFIMFYYFFCVGRAFFDSFT